MRAFRAFFSDDNTTDTKEVFDPAKVKVDEKDTCVGSRKSTPLVTVEEARKASTFFDHILTSAHLDTKKLKSQLERQDFKIVEQGY